MPESVSAFRPGHACHDQILSKRHAYSGSVMKSALLNRSKTCASGTIALGEVDDVHAVLAVQPYSLFKVPPPHRGWSGSCVNCLPVSG